MKRYHVIGISFFTGLIVGALLCGSAHATEYTCNEMLTKKLSFMLSVEVHQGFGELSVGTGKDSEWMLMAQHNFETQKSDENVGGKVIWWRTAKGVYSVTTIENSDNSLTLTYDKNHYFTCKEMK